MFYIDTNEGWLESFHLANLRNEKILREVNAIDAVALRSLETENLTWKERMSFWDNALNEVFGGVS